MLLLLCGSLNLIVIGVKPWTNDKDGLTVTKWYFNVFCVSVDKTADSTQYLGFHLNEMEK